MNSPRSCSRALNLPVLPRSSTVTTLRPVRNGKRASARLSAKADYSRLCCLAGIGEVSTLGEWEVQRALAETKRVLPVIFQQSVPDADIPAELQKRQFIRFDAASGITRPLVQLAEALRQDLDWIREHTRLNELAQRWDGRGHPVSLLLRGEELRAAQIWANHRKPGAPAVTDVILRLITASSTQEALDVAQSKAGQRRKRWTEFVAAFFAIAAVLTIVAWWQQDWLREKSYALNDVKVLAAAVERVLKSQSSF